MENDRYMHEDLREACNLVQRGRILDAVEDVAFPALETAA
jgi:hypothetical protein